MGTLTNTPFDPNCSEGSPIRGTSLDGFTPKRIDTTPAIWPVTDEGHIHLNVAREPDDVYACPACLRLWMAQDNGRAV